MFNGEFVFFQRSYQLYNAQVCNNVSLSSNHNKLLSTENRHQTALLSLLTIILDLDLWPWLSVPGELWSWPKSKTVNGQLSQKPEWKQMDTTDYTNFPLTQSEKISNWNWKRFWLGNLKFLVSFVNSGKLAGWSHPDFERSSYSENCAYYNQIFMAVNLRPSLSHLQGEKSGWVFWHFTICVTLVTQCYLPPGRDDIPTHLPGIHCCLSKKVWN